jgi:hypothetical protein
MYQLMKSVIFNKSGKIAMTKYVSGALSHVKDNMCLRNGTVERIRSNVTLNTKDMPDGNSDWPMGVYDVGKDGRIEVTMSSYNPGVHAFLLGVTISSIASRNMRENDEELLIPSAAPYTEELEHTPNDNITPILVDESDTEFTNVESSPATGEFLISSNEITFSSADAGKNVFLTYDWTAATADELGLPKSGNRPTLYAAISGEALSEDESTTYDTNVIVDRCKAIGDINIPEQAREPQPWTFTIRVLRPRGNNKAVDYLYAEQS